MSKINCYTCKMCDHHVGGKSSCKHKKVQAQMIVDGHPWLDKAHMADPCPYHVGSPEAINGNRGMSFAELVSECAISKAASRAAKKKAPQPLSLF